MRNGAMKVSKRQWYDTYGGFSNSLCYRKADSRGVWRYYVLPEQGA